MSRTRYVTAFLACAALLAGGGAAAQDPPGQAKGRKAKHAESRRAGGRAAEARPLTAPSEARPLDVALAYARGHAGEFGLTAADVADFVVTSSHVSEHSGVTHVYLRQRHNGIEVHGAEMNVHVLKDGRVLSASSRFVKELAARVAGATPDLGAAESAEAAAGHLGKGPANPIAVVRARGHEVTLTDGGISDAPINAQLVYEPLESGEVVLAWVVEIDDADTPDHWAMTIDASTGELLEQVNYTNYDHWEEPDWNEAAVETAADPVGLVPAIPTVPGSGTYRVFAWPFGDPNDGDRALTVDPADAISSPFGWHDTDGIGGAESSETVGNNVDAYLDFSNDNSAASSERADGGPGGVFDFAVDFAQNPITYRPAAVTNLFYWNNIIHDVLYRYGFTESAGNFQVNHYGRFEVPEGVNDGDGDPVRAEAQDAGGMNNANFSTGNDGNRPRMQMFLWVPQGGYQVQVQSGAAAGNYAATRANFGAFLADIFVTQPTAEVAATTPPQACTALPPGSLTGRVAFIEPGSPPMTPGCNNVAKVQRAQDAGAIGVILATTSAGAPGTITGFSATVNIPVLALNSADSATLRAALPAPAKMAFLGVPAPLRDGDFDAVVITHEYGHGVSNRLTGGRLVTGCLNDDEQMGEGWSDFLGLVLTHDGNRSVQRTRGLGPYIRFTGVDGPGIRTTRYSTDMTINPTTYGTTTTGTLSVPHGIGYAWATALWEVYWNLIDKHGFNQNIYEPWHTGGNNLALQLVIDGMKIQACDPGFVDGRDGVLAADMALTGGANQCAIWRGFAKRGLGFSAAQNDTDENDDNVEAFDMPPLCQAGVEVAPAAFAPTLIQDASAAEELQITNDTAADGLDLNWTITEAVSDCSIPSDVPWLSVSPAAGTALAQETDATGVTFDATGLDVGTYTAKLCIAGAAAGTVEVPVSMTVIYDFGGFGSPLGDGVNVRTAGAAGPVKFSLDGFKGLDIFAAGYPASRQVECAGGAPIGGLEAAVAAGGSALTYDATTDEYTWVWKTSRGWAGTCRELVVGLDDGTVHSMFFSFR